MTHDKLTNVVITTRSADTCTVTLGAACECALFVVKAGLQDHKIIAVHQVDEAVFLADAT